MKHWWCDCNTLNAPEREACRACDKPKPTVSVSQEAKDAGVPVRPVVVSFEAFPISTAPKDKEIMLLGSFGWFRGYWDGLLWQAATGRPSKPTHWAELDSMVPTEQTAEVSLTSTPPVTPTPEVSEEEARAKFDEWRQLTVRSAKRLRLSPWGAWLACNKWRNSLAKTEEKP
jgi:hypothetical protein